MSVDFLPANPFRPAAWRWQYAVALASGELQPDRKLDEWVRRAIRFQQARAKATTPAAESQLAYRFSDIYWATRLWDDIGDKSRKLLKTELEARVLANDDRDRIAERIGTTEEVIAAYEKLFFDVAGKLKNRSYIMHCVIGPSLHHGLSERDYDVIWKMFGYAGGPLVLDVFVETVAQTTFPTDRSQVSGFISGMAHDALRRKAAIAAHTIQVNNFSSIELITHFLKLVELERAEAGGTAGTGQASFLDNVAAMMDGFAVHLHIGERRGNDKRAPLQIEHYDASAVELSNSELVAAGAGQLPPLDPEVESLRFPESRPTTE